MERQDAVVFSSDDDFDEEIIEFIEYRRRPYVIREREDHFNEMDDHDFFVRFRLTKPTVLNILERIEQHIETVTDRNHSISSLNQLLLSLRFYATGCFLITAADIIKVSKSAASKIVKKVSYEVARLSNQYISMPVTDHQLIQAKASFYNKSALPKVIGSIDCTHIKIQSPGGENAELFRNRKGYFSVNVQTVSSTNLKILDIVARWPGSTHDQIIFDNCALKRRFENHEFGNSILVADSGYANTMHVITPLLQPTTEEEQLYNEAVTRTRNPVERQYGVWKRRFPVLALGLRLKLQVTLSVIVATAVLHNIALEANEEVPPIDPDLGINQQIFYENVEIEPMGEDVYVNARDHLLTDYFPCLFN